MNIPRPLAFRLVQMFDVGAWMKFARESLHEHVNPHCFKFEKVDSKVVMYYRKWSQDEWLGPINILKDNRPTGPPPLVQPSLNRQDIEGIKRDMPKFFGHMKATQKEFWEKIISNPDDLIYIVRFFSKLAPRTFEEPKKATKFVGS